MKKLSTALIVIVLLFTSCSSDDDIILLPQCFNAFNLTEIEINNTSAVVGWEDQNDSANFIVEYGPTGFEIGDGAIVNTTTVSATLTNLEANTSYDYYVKSVCSITNAALWSEVKTFTTIGNPVVPEFLQNLSQLNIYTENLADLTPSAYAFEYNINSTLFSDYAHKQRIIALPEGSAMTFIDDGLPEFPDNTVIAKTFYYNIDDRDESLGKTIIETRVLIKTNGVWETGDYKWNSDQTEATLDLEGSTVEVVWVDEDGVANNVSYEIPSNTDCFTCHQTFENKTPIGPKLRSLNFDIDGVNQLQTLITNQQLSGVTDPSSIGVLPNWEDDSFSREERARAYLDINCAHCHAPGGICEIQSTLDLRFETSFEDSEIFSRRFSMSGRISTYNPGFSMPWIGTTMIHEEGVDLIQTYLNSLD